MYIRHLPALTVALVLAACQSSSPTTPPAPPACSYSVSTSGLSFGAAGGSATLTITTGSSCAWTVAATAPWVTVAGTPSGAGSAVVTVAVSQNTTTEARQCAVTVAGQSFAVEQGAASVPCAYDLDPESERWPAEGGARTFAVRTGASCAWTAASTASWLTVTTGHDGTGPGTVGYAVGSWTGEQVREGTIRVADRVFTARQEPPAPAPIVCEYRLEPVDVTLHWHGFERATVQLTATDASCAWTVTSGGDWITVLGPESRTGSGEIAFSVPDLTAQATREAPIMVRWPTATAGQNVWVRQDGCYYALTETTRTFAASGGTANVMVFGTPMSTSCKIGCPWTAEPTVPWIRITSGSPNSGDEYFFYAVEANPTGAWRYGSIRVAGLTLAIAQQP